MNSHQSHITNHAQLIGFTAKMAALDIPKNGWSVTYKPYRRNRSLEQNSLSHAWYEQISRQLHEYTAEGVKCECKLRFGVPILRADDADFATWYDSAMKPILTYEQKIESMRYLPVTSLMNTAQLSRYLEQIQQEYAGRVDLRFPDE